MNKGISKRFSSIKHELDLIEKELDNITKLSNLKIKDLIPYNMKDAISYRLKGITDISNVRVEYVKEYLCYNKEEDNHKYCWKDLIEELTPIKLQNEEIVKYNKELLQILHDFLVTLGLSDYRYESIKTGRNSTRSEKRDAYWYEELKKMIPIVDNKWKEIEFLTNKIKNNIDEYYKLKDKEDKEEQVKKDKEQLFNEAIQYLLDHNKKVGIDFEINKAIEAADNLAFKIEKEKMLNEDPNIADDCWFDTSYDHTFKNPKVFIIYDRD